MKTLVSNKKAYFDYEILEEFVAGLQLEGREIKSLRQQKPSFAGSFVSILSGKPVLHELNIPRYKHDGTKDYSPKRKRLLLLKKSEIERIEGKTSQEGVTVVPLELVLDRQWAKVKIALVRGKKKYDKRRTIMEREEKIKMGRILKRY
jgi:SsrA-binding protein